MKLIYRQKISFYKLFKQNRKILLIALLTLSDKTISFRKIGIFIRFSKMAEKYIQFIRKKYPTNTNVNKHCTLLQHTHTHTIQHII